MMRSLMACLFAATLLLSLPARSAALAEVDWLLLAEMDPVSGEVPAEL